MTITQPTTINAEPTTINAKMTVINQGDLTNHRHTLAAQVLDSYVHYSSQLTGKRVWLACSGGRDSMALAYATFQLYKQGQLPFCPQLIHVNHGVQLANDAWEEQVSQWAKSVGMPCHVVKANCNQFKNTNTIDEQSARTARYQAIISLMKEGDVLMLAHHANDQTETVLMRLFNGAGVTGLSGIKQWTTKKTAAIFSTNVTTSIIDNKTSQLCINDDSFESKQIPLKTIHLWRPWLKITREQITNYAHEHRLAFIDDPTNVEGDNVRSWLRSDLLPTIKQMYPQVINSVSRSAQLFNDAHDILTEVYHQDLSFAEIKQPQLAPWDLALDVIKIKELSKPRQSQLIHRWLQGDEPTPAGKHRVDEILALIHRIDNDQQTELNWQGEYHSYSIRRYRNNLHRLRTDWLECLGSDAVWQTDIAKKQLEVVENLFLLTHTKVQKNQLANIKIRKITKHDKFAPYLNQKKQSGKKLMQLLNIPNWQRNCVQVVSNEQQVLCVFTPTTKWLVQ